ncbi:MAG TPA: hypothetical protein DC049_09565 [Spirochaetia bacterium]|nr:hypothetical protein [Spirochaetia bacterium]
MPLPGKIHSIVSRPGSGFWGRGVFFSISGKNIASWVLILADSLFFMARMDPVLPCTLPAAGIEAVSIFKIYQQTISGNKNIPNDC